MAKKFEQFVDPCEKGVAQIGSRRGSIVFDGAVDHEYCLLTDKRLYYKGVSYGAGNLGGKAQSETIIELTSITSTSFCIIKHVGLLLLSILFLLAGGIGAVLLMQNPQIMKIVLIAGGVLFALFLLLYFLIRKRLMRIVYSGSNLMLECWGQSEKNMREFCNAIHAAAERRRMAPVEVQISKPVQVVSAEPVVEMSAEPAPETPVEQAVETPAET